MNGAGISHHTSSAAGPPARAPALSISAVRLLTGAGLALIAVSYGLGRFAYGLFLPTFRSEFGLDTATAGAIGAGSYASYIAAIGAATVLAPRFGARAVAIGGGCLAGIGTALIALAPNSALLVTGVVIAGASTGAVSPALAQAVERRVPPAAKDRTQTVINAGTGVGVVVAGPIALLTADEWRGSWLVFAALCALATVWAAFAVPAARTAPGEGGPRPRLLPSPLLPPGSGRLVAAAILSGLASSATWTYGRDLLVGVGGLSDLESVVVWVVLGGCGILGAAAGPIASRLGLGAGWIAVMLLLAGATGLLAAFPGSVWIAGFAAAAFGATYIAFTGFLLLWGIRVYPADPAAGVGMAFLVLVLGQVMGALAVGVVSELTDPRIAFAGAAVVALLAAIGFPRRS